MILYITIFLLAVLAAWSFYRYRDIISPPVVLLIPWVISLLLLDFSDLDHDGGSMVYLLFIAGAVLFSIGYYIVSRKTDRFECYEKTTPPVLEVRHRMFLVVVVAEILLTAASLYFIASLAEVDSIKNAYEIIKDVRFNKAGLLGDLMLYFYTFEVAFTIFTVYVFMNSGSFPLRRTVFVLQFVLGLSGAALALGRTTLLLFVVATITVSIVSKGVKNGKIARNVMIAAALFIIFFVLYNFYKYTGFNFGEEERKGVVRLTMMYSSGSPAAFQHWFATEHELLYGRNILRFVFAVLQAVGFNVEPRSLLNDFVLLAPGITVNTYTFYHFYAMDFGIAFALLLQFPVGMLHGFLYNKAVRLKPIWIYFFALSLYPLLMQFFQDQYVSLTSAWIQYIFYGVIFYKSRLFIKWDK
ncbi:MAG TPA: O-antigen polymerase [Clostridia bacterium]|nr:O-antigen polymerase [Clostridia bacterium]